RAAQTFSRCRTHAASGREELPSSHPFSRREKGSNPLSLRERGIFFPFSRGQKGSYPLSVGEKRIFFLFSRREKGSSPSPPGRGGRGEGTASTILRKHIYQHRPALGLKHLQRAPQ